MCMDFRGLVSKRVWKITVFGLKPGQDLKSWAAHPHQEFLNVSYPPPPNPRPGWSRTEQPGLDNWSKPDLPFLDI